MPELFRYEALLRDGRRITAVVPSESEWALVAELRALGCMPTKVLSAEPSLVARLRARLRGRKLPAAAPEPPRVLAAISVEPTQFRPAVWEQIEAEGERELRLTLKTGRREVALPGGQVLADEAIVSATMFIGATELPLPPSLAMLAGFRTALVASARERYGAGAVSEQVEGATTVVTVRVSQRA